MSSNKLKIDLDATDREMLRLLQADAGLSNTALGERLSLSVTPCWRRRKRLENEGVIKDYQANLDRRILGFDVLAFVHVRFNAHTDDAPDRFEQMIQALPQVLSCHKITGDSDFVLQVLATDLDAFGEFIERVLRKQRGIASIHSRLALREVKSTSRVPVPDAPLKKTGSI
jgi:DNA-binding Lrp family transcriptional regulator